MFTIWNPGRDIHDQINGCYYKNFFPIDIEKKDWKLTENVKEAQFIAVDGHQFLSARYSDQLYRKIDLLKRLYLRPDQKLLIFHIWHVDNGYNDIEAFSFTRKALEEEIPNKFAIIHTNFANNQEIQYDFLWNRQKIYFTNYNYINLTARTYTHESDARNFQLGPIVKFNDEKNTQLKHYMCPNRIYKEYQHPRLEYRKKIRDIITSNLDKGYYSDPQNGTILPCENPNTNDRLQQGGWYPIANEMYNKTFLSVYTESLTGTFWQEGFEHVKYKSITEKTWDPLIKGHFILPFAYPGFIEHVKSYGFLFPDWIDYSYDTIEDDEKRFNGFLKSFEDFLHYSISDLIKLFHRDKYILEHNRELFWERPYDSLHDKVKVFFNMTDDEDKPKSKISNL